MTLCWVQLAEPQASEETLGSPLPLGGEELLGHAGLPVLPPRVRPQLLQRAVIQMLAVLRREHVNYLHFGISKVFKASES